MEVETQLQIALNLGYAEGPEVEQTLGMCAEVGKILNGLLASLASLGRNQPGE
jgi:four helix bundle protein